MTQDELVEKLDEHIQLLKEFEYFAEQDTTGSYWFVYGPKFVGVGTTEHEAWRDLLLDPDVANEILAEIEAEQVKRRKTIELVANTPAFTGLRGKSFEEIYAFLLPMGYRWDACLREWKGSEE